MKLSTKWIKAALKKRQSNYSTIICFQTDDPVRIKQFKRYLGKHPDYVNCQVYSFDPWNGLETTENGKRVVVSDKTTQEWDPGQNYSIANLDQALKYMDKIVKEKKTVFVLRNLGIFHLDQEKEMLWACLQSWALDDDILFNGSCIIIISWDISLVLDQSTMNLVILQKVPPPSNRERLQLIQHLATEYKLNLESPIETLAIATRGLTLYQLEGVLLESYNAMHSFDLNIIKQLKTEFIERSELIEIIEPDWGFERIGGYDAVKRYITENIIKRIKSPARAIKFGVPLPRGIILFGPPGTGKTLFAKAMAKEVNLPFINLKTENLYGELLGQTGKRFSEAIRLVEQHSPAIVFIDEIDKFGKRRGNAADGASEETRRALNQLLEWLGDTNRKSIIVGTTNLIQHLDDAFLRAGRFDSKIPFPYPGDKARSRILEIHLGIQRDAEGRLVKGPNAPPLSISDEELEDVLSKLTLMTRGYSGAELELLIINARRNACNDDEVDVMTVNHLMRAFEDYTIMEAKRESEIEDLFRIAEEYTDSTSFLNELRNEMLIENHE